MAKVGDDGLTREQRKAKLEEKERASIGTTGSELAKRREDATLLLMQALDSARNEDFESALWRAVDAAGLLSFFVDRNSVGMPPNPTGRGFFININR
jgi:hypothetical protein